MICRMAHELEYRSPAADAGRNWPWWLPRETIIKLAKGLALAGLITVVAAGVGVYWSMREPFGKATFSAAAWRQADNEGRGTMSRDLMTRHLAVGMSEAQVTALLGKPGGVNRGDQLPADRLRGAFFYVYSIGSWSAGGMDDAFLYVHFDSAGRVMASEIYGF